MKLAARFSETMTLPLLVLLATLLAALALIKLSADRAVFDSQQAQLRDAQTRLQKSGTEKELIIRHLPDYAKLDALGFVGDEQRINWLDALRHANQKGGLFGINYDIAARKAYPHAATLNPGGVNVSQSLMKIKFQLLHEADLIKFFAHLAEQNAGVFLLNSCSLRRSGNTPAMRFQPHVNAECELAWITAQPAPATEARP
ncbi:MAG: hypothetical protein FJY56_09125 [Betaproteobacteria bacterium]|nr:hypothetical protein [Betaproteobacteria bacterium]